MSIEEKAKAGLVGRVLGDLSKSWRGQPELERRDFSSHVVRSIHRSWTFAMLTPTTAYHNGSRRDADAEIMRGRMDAAGG